MGRLFVIQYDLTPDNGIYMCNTCHTHMTFQLGVSYFLSDNESLLMVKTVNVVADNQEDYYIKYCFGYRIVAANVHCVACNTLLGYKLIEVDQFDEIFREGRLVLKLRKLLYWNGQQMIDAITTVPPDSSDEHEDD